MVAPFCLEHCATCGRVTKHWHRDPSGPDPPGGDCDECGHFTPAFPRDDVYWVLFTNVTDLSVEPVPGQYFLGTYQKARSAAEALEAALPWALGDMHRRGLPPHGMQISEEELRRQTTVIPDREMFYDGFVDAFNKCRQMEEMPARVREALEEMTAAVEALHRDQVAAITEQAFERSADLRARAEALRERKAAILRQWQQAK